MPDGHHFDLVDGHLVERHMGAESSWIAQQVNRHLRNDVAASQGGLVRGPDCGYQIFPDDPNQVRSLNFIYQYARKQLCPRNDALFNPPKYRLPYLWAAPAAGAMIGEKEFGLCQRT